jgi:hypothetical protein
MAKKAKGFSRQVSQYDEILQENIEAALPGLIKNVLHIKAITSEELPDNIQHTKERKPDLLKKITDDKGETFVLHIEFQTRNDADMPYRMAEYLVMLLRMYRIPVRQYVIYIGEGTPTMPNTLTNGKSHFHYDVIAISTINYKIFLRAKKPEEKMFAILADFGKDSPEAAITKIASDIAKTSKGDLEKERRKNQLRILAQLRTLVSDKIEIMERVSSFFKEENDIFYKVGEKRGSEKEKVLFVKNLLLQTDHTITKIADLAGVTEAFVREIKKGL